MTSLIADDEPAPFLAERPDASSRFLFIADHAGNRVPQSLAQLGLPKEELDRHIGIDIGILGVGKALSEALDATLIHQPYSRLVIDCNRRPGRADAMPAISDGTVVPGNQTLSAADRTLREQAIFWPYHNCIRTHIDARIAAHHPPVLVALHSFTPRHGDYPAPRPWHIGVLWNRDATLAREVISALQAQADLTVGLNEPYGVSDDVDYAIPVHAEVRGLLHVELEIRQDLITTPQGQAIWAARLATILPVAADRARLHQAMGAAR